MGNPSGTCGWKLTKPVFDPNTPQELTKALRLSVFDDSGKYVHEGTAGSGCRYDDKFFIFVPSHLFPDNILRKLTPKEDEATQEEGEASDAEDVRKTLELEVLIPCSVTPQLSNYGEHLDSGSEDACQMPAKVYTHRPCHIFEEMDCALIECPDKGLIEHLDEISMKSFSRMERLRGVKIEVATGSGNFLKGTLTGNEHHRKVNGSRIAQELLEVTFETPLRAGDCGSLVRNARNNNIIYGHIVNENIDGSKIAYVVPATAVWREARDKFDELKTRRWL